MNEKLIDQTTNPASEIVALFELFNGLEYSHPADTTLEVLSDHFGFNASSPEWFELIGIVASRIRSLREFISTVQDKFVQDRMRSQALDSLNQLSRLLQPEVMQNTWHNSKPQLQIDVHLGRIESFAQVSEKYRPLRLIPDEERQELLLKIAEMLKLLSENEDLPEWSIVPIKIGFDRLSQVLKHLEFFGHEAAIDALLLLHTNLNSLTGYTEELTNKTALFDILRKGMHIVFFTGELLLLPANAYQGYNVYKDISLEFMMNQKEDTLQIINEKAGQKALPDPKKKAKEKKNVGPQ